MSICLVWPLEFSRGFFKCKNIKEKIEKIRQLVNSYLAINVIKF